uniref:V-SNARE coiled-coil homology domain-containing protein n=1 Tax=Knipowitschia caucasica TaxID=637954 RepID=A0AAV2MC26_KNICA
MLRAAKSFSTGVRCPIRMHAIPEFKKVDRWTEKRSMFGVYDNIGILGDFKAHPRDLILAPCWLKGFKGNELQRLIRKKRMVGDRMMTQDRHDLEKRIRFLSAPDAQAGAPGAPGAPGADGAPGGGPPAPPNTSSNRRLQQTQAQVEEVVDIMRVNVDKVLERDQKLSELDDRADALQAGASQFESCAAKLKNKYWWKNCKMMIMMGIIGVIVVGIIFLYFFY